MSNQQTLFAEGDSIIQKAITKLAASDAAVQKALAVNHGPIPTGEIATIQRTLFLDKIAVRTFPNFSTIINYRSNGEYLGFYDTMLATDADLWGLYGDLHDSVLHYPIWVRPASENPDHILHGEFVDAAIKHVPQFQNCLRHMLTCHPRGFAVSEKVYEVIPRGRWAGSVMYAELLDREQKYFDFDLDRNLLFKTLQNPYPGELVNQEKFVVVQYGTNSLPHGLPTLDHAYWAWYLKHHAMKNQAIFFEKWAQPTAAIDYKSDRNEQVNQQRLDEALAVVASFQADGAVAVPEGMNLRLIESLRQGAISYEAYINQLTEMESRAVTGQILTMFGAKGGSYALGKVHEKRLSQKSHMLGRMLSHQVSRLFRDLVDRNFGPQDAYPQVRIFTLDPLEKQAAIENEKGLQQNGHEMSKAWSDEFFEIVPPRDTKDILTPPEGAAAAQTLPVNPTLAESDLFKPKKMVFFASSDLKANAKAQGKALQSSRTAITKQGQNKARPAIHAVVKQAASKLKKKKNAAAIRPRHVMNAVTQSNVTPLAQVYHSVMQSSVDDPSFAEGTGTPPDISTEAKLMLALQVVAIAERISDAAAEAPELTGDEFANALTSPDAFAIPDTLGNMFDAVHGTNVSSVATAELRRKLDDPAFRKAFPYVMIVVTNPNARLGHRMMDGFVMTAEEARVSPMLPPFDFGCDCVAIPISAAEARAAGLTGAGPTLEEQLTAQGATRGPRGFTVNGAPFTPGTAPGFQPAYGGTDLQVQLEALREQARELQSEDPEAWSELATWLIWLFGVNVLLEDPPADATTEPN